MSTLERPMLAGDESTIYTVTNPSHRSLMVTHTFLAPSGRQVYRMRSTVAAKATSAYHLRSIGGVPGGWEGIVQLEAGQAFSAEVSGAD